MVFLIIICGWGELKMPFVPDNDQDPNVYRRLNNESPKEQAQDIFVSLQKLFINEINNTNLDKEEYYNKIIYVVKNSESDDEHITMNIIRDIIQMKELKNIRKVIKHYQAL